MTPTRAVADTVRSLTSLRDVRAVRQAQSPHDLAAEWDALADEDAARAYRAVLTLAGAPARLVVPLLKDRLRPAAAADPQLLARLADARGILYPLRFT